MMTKATRARLTNVFFRNIDFTDSAKGNCWNWTDYQRRGYGSMAYTQNKRKHQIYAHRFSYELHYGPIPKGMWILHNCDNRLCVRPQHIRLGTHFDNMTDMVNRDRQAFGERNSQAKLTAKDVRKIRKLKGLLTSNQIATVFKVSSVVIRRVWCGMYWGKVK